MNGKDFSAVFLDEFDRLNARLERSKMKTKKVEIKCFANLYPGWNTPGWRNADIVTHSDADRALSESGVNAEYKAVPCTVILEIPERTVTISESEFDEMFKNRFGVPFSDQMRKELFGGGE